MKIIIIFSLKYFLRQAQLFHYSFGTKIKNVTVKLLLYIYVVF